MELTKRLSPHKIHATYNVFGGENIEQSGSKTGRSGGGHARNLSHFERVALQKQILANGRSRKTFDVSMEISDGSSY